MTTRDAPLGATALLTLFAERTERVLRTALRFVDDTAVSDRDRLFDRGAFIGGEEDAIRLAETAALSQELSDVLDAVGAAVHDEDAERSDRDVLLYLLRSPLSSEIVRGAPDLELLEVLTAVADSVTDRLLSSTADLTEYPSLRIAQGRRINEMPVAAASPDGPSPEDLSVARLAAIDAARGGRRTVLAGW